MGRVMDWVLRLEDLTYLTYYLTRSYPLYRALPSG